MGNECFFDKGYETRSSLQCDIPWSSPAILPWFQLVIGLHYQDTYLLLSCLDRRIQSSLMFAFVQYAFHDFPYSDGPAFEGAI